MITLLDYLKQHLNMKEGAKSLYVQLEELITNAITEEGMFKKGDKLPASDVMSKELGINRLTFQRAYRQLKQKGVVDTHRGIGTFVLVDSFKYPKMVIETKLTAYMSFSTGTKIKLLHSERCGPEACTSIPDAEKADSYQRLLRVHSKSNFPYSYNELFLASDMFDAHPENFEKKLCMRATVAALGKENVREIYQTWTIRKATPEIAHHLNMAVGDPVAKVHRTIHSTANIAVYINDIVYPGAIIEFNGTWDLE